MKSFSLIDIVLLLSCLEICATIVVKETKQSNKNQASPQLHHQTNKHFLHYRQPPQKCDLVCPGQPPLELPPNFIKNCGTVVTTTPKPGQPKPTGSTGNPSTSTSSGEEGESTEENTEQSRTSTKKAGKRRNRQGRIHTTNHDLRSNPNKKNVKSKHSNNKYNQFRREKIMLKSENKSKMFGKKRLQDKLRLDGCYVVCSENEGNGNTGGNDSDQSSGPDTSSGEGESDEPDEDPYIKGEDTPIEIIYVPSLTEESKRPIEVFQMTNLNNYEGFGMNGYPVQPPSFGYEPMFMEGKHRKAKRRQHNTNNAIKTKTKTKN